MQAVYDPSFTLDYRQDSCYVQYCTNTTRAGNCHVTVINLDLGAPTAYVSGSRVKRLTGYTGVVDDNLILYRPIVNEKEIVIRMS